MEGDYHLTPSSLDSVSLDEQKDAVEKLLKSNKAVAKITRNQLREIAQLLAQVHLSSPSPDPFVCIHR